MGANCVRRKSAKLLAAAGILSLIWSGATAQGMPEPATPTAAMAVTSPPPPAPAALPHAVKVPEGTEIHVELGEKLSSATSAEGDVFSIITDEEIVLPDGTVIPPGYSGRGEVTNVSKAGMVGKSGQLNIRLDYLKVGDRRIRLRANKGGEGKSGVTNMVVTTVLIGPLGLLVRGHTITYPKGMKLVAYVDQDGEVPMPLPPPPNED